MPRKPGNNNDQPPPDDGDRQDPQPEGEGADGSGDDEDIGSLSPEGMRVAGIVLNELRTELNESIRGLGESIDTRMGEIDQKVQAFMDALDPERLTVNAANNAVAQLQPEINRLTQAAEQPPQYVPTPDVAPEQVPDAEQQQVALAQTGQGPAKTVIGKLLESPFDETAEAVGKLFDRWRGNAPGGGLANMQQISKLWEAHPQEMAFMASQHMPNELKDYAKESQDIYDLAFRAGAQAASRAAHGGGALHWQDDEGIGPSTPTNTSPQPSGAPDANGSVTTQSSVAVTGRRTLSDVYLRSTRQQAGLGGSRPTATTGVNR